jgi:hypothetical protein
MSPLNDVAPRWRSLDEVLELLNSEMEAWEVRAFFLGAQASTNVPFGPQHLLVHLFESELMVGENTDEAKANLGVITATWNALVDERLRGHIRLSALSINDPPTPSDLVAVGERRVAEIVWFFHGVHVGGEGPMNLEPEGQNALRRLGAAGALCEAYTLLVGSKKDQTQREVSEAVVTLGKITIAVVKLMGDVLSAGAAVRQRAGDEMATARLGIRNMAGRHADPSTSEAQPRESRRNLKP